MRSDDFAAAHPYLPPEGCAPALDAQTAPTIFYKPINAAIRLREKTMRQREGRRAAVLPPMMPGQLYGGAYQERTPHREDAYKNAAYEGSAYGTPAPHPQPNVATDALSEVAEGGAVSAPVINNGNPQDPTVAGYQLGYWALLQNTAGTQPMGALAEQAPDDVPDYLKQYREQVWRENPSLYGVAVEWPERQEYDVPTVPENGDYPAQISNSGQEPEEIERTSEGVFRRLPNGLYEKLPEEMYRRLPNGSYEKVLAGMYNGSPNGMHGSVPNGRYDDTPNERYNGAHNRTPNGVRNGAHNGMPGGMYNGTPHEVYDGAPGGMYNGTPNSIYDRAPVETPMSVYGGPPPGMRSGTQSSPNDIYNRPPNGMHNGSPNSMYYGTPGSMYERTPSGRYIEMPEGTSENRNMGSPLPPYPPVYIEASEPYTPVPEEPADPQDPDDPKPPISLFKVVATCVIVVILLILLIQLAGIIITLIRNEEEMKDIRQAYYNSVGKDLAQSDSRVDLLPPGVTYVPTQTASPLSPGATAVGAPAVDGSSASQMTDETDLLERDTDPENVISLSQRTKADQYESNPLGAIREAFATLCEGNADIVGHLMIDGLLDEIVVLKNNTYYLTRNARGAVDSAGAVFADESCKLEAPPENLILRGQSAVEGKLFASLLRYLDGGVMFLRQNALIRMDTIYEEGEYVIFAVIPVSGNPQSSGYYNYAGHPTFPNDREMERYVSRARQNSRFEIPVDVLPSDRLLTISTLGNGAEKESLVIIARMLRPGETAQTLNKALSAISEK